MIGIVTAMETEAEPFLRGGVAVKEKINGKSFYLLEGADAVLTVCGVGKVNAAFATATLVSRYNPDIILNCGVSGGLQNVSVFDVVVADGCVQHDVDTSPLGDPVGFVSTVNTIVFPTDKELSEKIIASGDCKRGISASGEQFIASAEKKKRIIDVFGATICDMESGAVAQCAYIAGKKFVCVRCVSDCGDGQAPTDYGKFCKDASEKLFEAVRPIFAE